MFLTRCPLCEHDNPERSKFCNACGVSLLRMGVCARCGGLNELTAGTCHQCAAVLREPASPAGAGAVAADTGELGRPPPAAAIDPDVFRAPPRPAAETGFAAPPHRSAHRHAGLNKFQRWLIAGSAFGAVIGAFGYVTHSQWTVIDVSGLLPETQVEPLVIGSGTDLGEGSVVNVDVALGAGSPAVLAATTRPLVTRRPAPLSEPEVEPPSPPKRTTETRARPSSRTAADSPANETAPVLPAPAHLGPCTAPVAALGLCTPEPSPTRE